MDEVRVAVKVLMWTVAGYVLAGDLLADRLHQWFGLTLPAPLDWLGGLAGRWF